MNRETLAELVRATVARYLPPRQRGAHIGDATRIVADLGLDSLAVLEATVDLEDALDIEVSDHEVAALVTVGELVAHLAGRLELAEVVG